MLILSRKAEEKIKIGDDIIVSILSVENGIVKLGIDAPKQVTILRMEVVEQIKKENIESAAKDIKDITEAAELLKKKLSGEKED